MPPEPGKPTSASKSSPGKSSANVKALAMDDTGPKKSNNELAVQECGLGREWTRAPRLPLKGPERRQVLKVIHDGLAARPKLPPRASSRSHGRRAALASPKA